jgi:quinol monooxygenase YgiN
MKAASLTVVARIKAKPGQEAVLRQELLGLLPITRQEPGCLNYDLHEAVDQPGHFLFHENWTSKQHLDEHLGRPHVQALLAKADALFAEPPQIMLWEKIG